MIYECNHYRGFLKAELMRRTRQNPAYSTRAMARQLGLAPSTLVEVLGGQKHLSAGRAHGVAKKLGLAGAEAEYFRLLVQAESPDARKNPDLKAELWERIRSLHPNRGARDLSVDAFQLIAEWYHLPILELAGVEGFDLTPKSAARSLGIPSVNAELAIERLLRLELLEKDKNGKLCRTDGRWIVESKVANPALRRFHRQMLEKAVESLETQSPEEKLVGSETFALDPSALPLARAAMDRFLDEVQELAKKSSHKTKVYHLGVQCFDLTYGGKKK